MAKIRLNDGYRCFLSDLAKQVAKCPAEEKAENDAYKPAAKAVHAIVVARYPVKDMAVLQRYQAAEPDTCIRLQLAAGGVHEFKFRDGDAIPLAPGGRCYSRMYQADADATKIIEIYNRAHDAHKKARKSKLADYEALIKGATTLEEVEEVWPEASALRSRAGRALPMVLSDEVIARIKADAAARLRQAA